MEYGHPRSQRMSVHGQIGVSDLEMLQGTQGWLAGHGISGMVVEVGKVRIVMLGVSVVFLIDRSTFQGGDGNSGEEGLEAGTERLVSRIERRLTPQRRFDEDSWGSPGLESLQERKEFTDLPS